MTNAVARESIERLATRAVRKIDSQGQRGITLCSMEEIEAMALQIVLLKAELNSQIQEVTHDQ
ncbi:MAG: hypothetical protein AAGM84_05465 [Pseudomonadota bacterium]